MKSILKSLNGNKDGGIRAQVSTPVPLPAVSNPPPAILPPQKVIRALSEYRPQAPQELPFKKGDFFCVLRDVDAGGNWYEAHNPVTGARGLVPRDMFEEFNKSAAPVRSLGSPSPGAPKNLQPSQSPQQQFQLLSPMSPNSPPKTQVFYAIVLHDFMAERVDELEAKRGDAITVVAQSNREWFVAKPIGRLGRPGLIPVSFVEIHDPSTGRPIPAVNALMDRGDLPKVEDWKRAMFNYKQNSISLGVIDSPNPWDSVPNSPFKPQSSPAAPPDPAISIQGHSPHEQTYSNNVSDSPPPETPDILPDGILLSANVVSCHSKIEEYWFRVEAIFQPYASAQEPLPPAKSLILFRVYNDFYDFHVSLLDTFPREAGRQPPHPRWLPYMPGPAENVDDTLTLTRRSELDEYVISLCHLSTSSARYVLEHHVVREFLALKPGDIENIIPQHSNPLDDIHRGRWFEIHQSFLSYVLHTLEGHDSSIAELSKEWTQWDIVTSLANYRSVVQILFGYLNVKDSRNLPISASNALAEDISGVLRQMNSILLERATYKHFLSSRGIVAQQLLDLLQDLLDSSHELASKALLSKALLRLSGECGLHPTCFPLCGVEKLGFQVAAGGFGDVWKGSVGGQTVAIKSTRQFRDDDVKVSLKKFGREALIWRQLSHPNLLPFFGLYMLDDRLSLVSPWMDNGDLKHFLSNPPPDIDRISLIADVARGLEYLHSKHVVHGDLKTLNILVTPSGRACIADFGLSSIFDELSLRMTFSTRSARAGTVRYQAPELLKNDRRNHFGSDVYAFACVCYEILTGKVPFSEIANEAAIILKVIEGIRPSGLEMIPQDLRLLLDDCWHQEADERPTAAAILQRLPIGQEIRHSPPDWDDTCSARFRRSIQEWPLLPSIDEIERRIPSNVATLGTSRMPYDGGSRRSPFPSKEWSLHNWTRASPTSPSPTHTYPIPTRTFPHPELVVHRWLNPEVVASSLNFHFDLANAVFAPVRIFIGTVPYEPMYSRNLHSDELRESAFFPPLVTLRILHPRIPFWPIDFIPSVEMAADPAASICLGDVLVMLHSAMHQRVTDEELKSLEKNERRDVDRAFSARCRDEATRDKGVKRVDYLLGKTLLKGLVSAPEDPPGWMRIMTA